MYFYELCRLFVLDDKHVLVHSYSAIENREFGRGLVEVLLATLLYWSFKRYFCYVSIALLLSFKLKDF